MASRNGLSKREVKRASAAKALTAKKSSVKSSPRVAPLAGAGPLMKGQTRVANSYGGGSQLQGAGPLLQGQTRVKDSYSGDSAQRRKEASKAVKDSKPGFMMAAPGVGAKMGFGADLGGELLADTSSRIGRMARGKIGQIGSGWAAVGKGLGDLVHSPDLGITESLGVNKFMDYFKTPTANASEGDLSSLGKALQETSQPDIPTSVSDDGSLFFNGNTKKGITRNDIIEPETGRVRGISGDSDYKLPNFINTAQAETRDTRGDEDPSLLDEVRDTETALRQRQEDQRQLQNEQFGGGDMADIPGATTGNRSGRGSGMFGTGKGYQGNPLLDEYQAQLKGFRKQGNKMEDLYDDMLKALDPTYDAYSADIKKSVDEELRQNLLQLASVMNANNTGDSEQRAQFMAQRQGQSEAQLGDLLRKLMLQKQEDAQGIKEKKVNSLSQLQDRQMTTREKMAGLMAELEKDRTKGGSGSLKKNANLIALMQKAANMTSGGADWARRNAETYGVDPSSLNLTGNWGDGFRDAPKATSPQRSAAPRPTKIDDGVYIDGNPYSPTYGQQLEWQD